MSTTPNPSKAEAPPPTPAVKKLLDWLPWEKILIWGLFVLTVYALRHFFFIIFVTFIVAYIMRSSVRRISSFILRGRENVWVDRGLTVGGFVLLLLGLYVAGLYVGPALFDQGKALVQRVQTIEPEKELNNLITRTVGYVLFHHDYSTLNDARYKEKFEAFQQAQGPGTQAFDTFSGLVASIEKLFESEERGKIRAKLTDKGKSSDKDFQKWFLDGEAQKLFEENREKHIQEWEKRYIDAAEVAGLPPLEDFKTRPDYEAHRDSRIKDSIFREKMKSPQDATAYRERWVTYVEETAFSNIKSSPQYAERFRDFYEKLRKGEIPAFLSESKPSYEYDKYLELIEAYKKGEDAFKLALQDLKPKSEEERLAQAREAFEQSETRRLVSDWLKSPTYLQAREWVSNSIKSGLDDMGGWVRSLAGYVINVPIQLALSLLLSFFITFDIPRLRRGILGLRNSRVKDFFEEIAPGLYNFGRLIGRAFQAQGVIALFNTLLTFIAIRALQIQNETFLCALVFICSFIPVLGVVLSSVPIAIVAIVQPGGSIILALEAFAAILVIHFIETSVLNPEILGEMLHLHPVLVLAVLAIGEHFFSVWGLLLAVPVTVFIIRSVILDEEIPGLIEQDPLAKIEKLSAPPAPRQDHLPPPLPASRTATKEAQPELAKGPAEVAH